MNKVKKILSIDLKEKWVASLAVAAMVLLMLPLIRLAFYAVPYFDDYLHIRFPRGFYIEYGGFSGWFRGVCYAVKSQYYAWQGTYSTQFIVSANPIILGEEFYGYSVIVVLVLFVFLAIFSIYRLTRRLMNMEKAASVIMSIVVTAAMLELIHTAQQGIYWFNGAVHYTLMHGMMLLMLMLAVEILYVKSNVCAVGLMILMVFVGIVVAGSNFVTILQCLLVLLTIIALGALWKKKRTLLLVLPTVIYAFCFRLNVSAPGNAVRAGHFEGYGVVKSVLYSFKSAAEEFWNFTGLIMIVVLLLALPVIVNTVKRMDFSFKYPGLVTAYSICLYATGFTSSYYGMGNSGVSRAWIVIKFTLQLLLFVNEIYWVGWLTKRKTLPQIKHYPAYYAVLGCAMLLIFAFSSNQAGSFSSYGAYYYVHSGEAFNFYSQYEERIETIKSSGPVVELEPYAWRPFFLCIGDLSTNPTASANQAIAQWYYKDAIYIKE